MGLRDKIVIHSLSSYLQRAFQLKAEYMHSLEALDSLVRRQDTLVSEGVSRVSSLDRYSDGGEVDVFVRVDLDEEDIVLEP